MVPCVRRLLVLQMHVDEVSSCRCWSVAGRPSERANDKVHAPVWGRDCIWDGGLIAWLRAQDWNSIGAGQMAAPLRRLCPLMGGCGC
jgi:hypothetical protein